MPNVKLSELDEYLIEEDELSIIQIRRKKRKEKKQKIKPIKMNIKE